MFGLFCKGLHCAGCGKGIPLSIIMIVLAIAAMNSHEFTAALGRILVEIIALCAIAWIATIVIYAIFCRKGPKVVSCRTDRIWYSEMKYMETGNPDWLAFTPPRKIAPKESAPVIIRGEVEHVERNSRLFMAFLHGSAHEREDVQ